MVRADRGGVESVDEFKLLWPGEALVAEHERPQPVEELVCGLTGIGREHEPPWAADRQLQKGKCLIAQPRRLARPGTTQKIFKHQRT